MSDQGLVLYLANMLYTVPEGTPAPETAYRVYKAEDVARVFDPFLQKVASDNWVGIETVREAQRLLALLNGQGK